MMILRSFGFWSWVLGLRSLIFVLSSLVLFHAQDSGASTAKLKSNDQKNTKDLRPKP